MLTLAQENILITLVNMSDAERQNLKLSVLALRAKVCDRTVRSALKVLLNNDLIAINRPCEHGPDATYTFEIKQRAIHICNGIKIAQEFRNVPVPIRLA